MSPDARIAPPSRTSRYLIAILASGSCQRPGTSSNRGVDTPRSPAKREFVRATSPPVPICSGVRLLARRRAWTEPNRRALDGTRMPRRPLIAIVSPYERAAGTRLPRETIAWASTHRSTANCAWAWSAAARAPSSAGSTASPPCSTTAPPWSPGRCRPIRPRPRRRRPITTSPPTAPTARTRK